MDDDDDDDDDDLPSKSSNLQKQKNPDFPPSNLQLKVFALVRSDGKMTVWGEATHGGYIPRALQPSSVASVVLGCRALAVLLTDGRVQSFGDAQWGGDTWWIR